MSLSMSLPINIGMNIIVFLRFILRAYYGWRK
jgi:hypothetical protein